MAVERTLSIIKPDAVAANVVGKIYARFEAAELKLAAAKMIYLSQEQAAAFYAEHEGRVFYEKLIAFMTEGPVFVQVLEGEGAIAKNREIMGVTDLAEAAAGTIRADFASDVTRNAVHGSDSDASAQREINFFFEPSEIFSR